MAVKRIVILQRMALAGGRVGARVAMRADVPAARQVFYANTDAVSAWQGNDTQDQADLAAIKAGALVEETASYHDTTSDASQTEAEFFAALVALFDDFQSRVANETKFSHTGSSWDGTAWTLAGA